MCGRFTLSKPVKAVAELFKLTQPPAELAPRFNIAPSQTVAVVGLKGDGVSRGLTFLKWGLVPSWANAPDDGFKPTNARGDSLHKPTFRAAFKSKRCLIPASGFFEWVRREKL
jgi:putative SOS response-associated peptidase YedK